VAARDRIRVDGPFAMPAMAVVLSFVGIVLLPMTWYLLFWHPAWVWMYWFDPEKIPTLAVIPLGIAIAGMVLIGYHIGGRLMRQRHRARVGLYIVIAGALIVLIGAVVTWNAVGYVGTYEEWKGKRALPLMEVKLGYVMVAMVLGIAVASAFAATELNRDSRRVRSR
jgi:hypothetical protein